MDLVAEIVADKAKGTRRLVSEYGNRLYETAIRLCGNEADLSGLKECYEQARQYFSCRYLASGAHVVTEENYPAITARMLQAGQEMQSEEAGSGDLLVTALEYIDSHYTDENISLNIVASQINVSPGYFSAMFSQKMDQTFVEYVTAKRIERAKHLLKTTREHTSGIAALVGYKDPNYFRYVFKKLAGCTPREFRNR